jgi:hypothetical protein
LREFLRLKRRRRHPRPGGDHDVVQNLVRVGDEDHAIRLDPVRITDVVDFREFLKIDAIRTGNGGECLAALYTMINPAGPGVPEGQTRAGEDHQTD